ncbi:MAG: HAD-IA family hydrolase, partial [Alphaproteobacteria bacterium]
LHIAQSRFHDIGPARQIGIASMLVDRRAGRPGRGVTMPSEAEPDYRVETMAQAAELVARLRAGKSVSD